MLRLEVLQQLHLRRYPSYWSGIAMIVMLSAIFPSFPACLNKFPAMNSANVITEDFIGTMIYFVFFLALMFVKPYKLQPFCLVSSAGVYYTIIGIFIWSVAANHGAGNLVSP
ncbi:hypothetical protein GE09DRAFT_1088381 [Coniochaeta sp. 2T2.1]|nr:hypothetical protein GE09DRAFT_1088381 [Coniochaeta sp. 2T2.1]